MTAFIADEIFVFMQLAKSYLRQLFSRPSGVGGMESFGQTDRHLVRVFGQTDRHSYGYIAKSTYYKNFFVCALIITKILLLAPLCPKESKYVLRYEIGPLEVGQKTGQNHRQTDRQTENGKL